MSTMFTESDGLLILPHLRIQNANAISSPMTHGFPSMTAFLGLMWALERKLAAQQMFSPAFRSFDSVGVICHGFDEQTTEGGYVKAFRLTRNPVDKDGSTAAIVEEGRIHLDITLVFGVSGGFIEHDEAMREEVARNVLDVLSTLRVAGGSVLPPAPSFGRAIKPELIRWADDVDDARKQFRRLRRQWLPGFALVCRDDLLYARLDALQAETPESTALDAWLDLSRFNWRPVPSSKKEDGKIEWQHDRTEGWLVPIPVGYAALSDSQPAGSVLNVRDAQIPFRFVESLYSIGQWLGAHRLSNAQQLLWYAQTVPEKGLYRIRNNFAPPAPIQPD